MKIGVEQRKKIVNKGFSALWENGRESDCPNKKQTSPFVVVYKKIRIFATELFDMRISMCVCPLPGRSKCGNLNLMPG